MKAINYFRMHLLNLQTCRDDLLVIMLDNMYLSVTQDGVDDYAQPEPEPTPEATPDETPESDQPTTGEVEVEAWPGGEEPKEDVDVVAARKALTARRARSLAIVFVFMIIGANVVVAAVMRKQEECAVAAEGETPVPQMLEVSGESETAEPSAPVEPTSDQTTEN